MYRSTKTYGHEVGLSVAFRQWKADSHCKYLHGYALAVKLEFEAQTLDARNWVMDFGGLKEIKSWLVKNFDHKTLIAYDDPALCEFQQLHDKGVVDLVVVKRTGCEAFAFMIACHVRAWLMTTQPDDRINLASVEVREHGANSAIYIPHKKEQ